MKRIVVLPILVLFTILTSCYVIVVPEPDLRITVDYAGSSSYDGYYEIDLTVANGGSAQSYVSGYYLQLTGSTGTPIGFDAYGPSISDLQAGQSQYITVYGYTDEYVPYGFEVYIEYTGSDGLQRTETAAGDFVIGDPGTPYIAYSWDAGPFTYSTDDPGIPDLIYNGQYYETYPGTWDFWYQSWDGSAWIGTYTIYRDTGDAGVDGDDYYFELYCLPTGPSFVMRTYPASADTPAMVSPEDADTAGKAASPTIETDAASVVEEGRIGPFRYILEYRRAE